MAQAMTTGGSTASGYSFARGYPTGHTSRRAYDAAELERAIQASKFIELQPGPLIVCSMDVSTARRPPPSTAAGDRETSSEWWADGARRPTFHQGCVSEACAGGGTACAAPAIGTRTSEVAPQASQP